MNRKNLTAAVLAGLAGVAGIVGSAQAVNINPDGLGQVLIYPYYTTNGGNDTTLSVVNTSGEAKAVKVRFMEGKNSQEVLDFNLYMSAYDVWTAAIQEAITIEVVAGIEVPLLGPTLVTHDSSCTVPYLYENDGDNDGVMDGMQRFLPFKMVKDGGGGEVARMTEGHFEMIEMGTLTGSSAAAATHGDDGMPASCDTLNKAWFTGNVTDGSNYWIGDNDPFAALIDMEAPSGGMFGGAAIVNPDNGAMYSYDATALNGFADAVFANDILHQVPGNTKPSLNSGNIYTGLVFGDEGNVESWEFDDQSNRPVDAVSYVFMHDQLMNEYTTELSVLAGTEWVVTFPTKSFYVFEDQSGSVSAVAPFTSTWGADELLGGYGACEVILLDTIWDREEARPGSTPGVVIPPIVSPAPPDINPDGIVPFRLCYETSVIRFGASGIDDALLPDATKILGSANYHNINNVILGYQNGWVNLNMDDYPHDEDGSGIIDPDELLLTRDPLGNLEGLPVTGFAAQRFLRTFIGSGEFEGLTVRANYGGIYDHKSTRKISSAVQ
jgi:hypothetical protein